MNDTVPTTPQPITRFRSLLKELHATVAERARAEAEAHFAHNSSCADANERFEGVADAANSQHESVVKSAKSKLNNLNQEVQDELDQIKSATTDTESFLKTVDRGILVGDSFDQIKSAIRDTESFLKTVDRGILVSDSDEARIPSADHPDMSTLREEVGRVGDQSRQIKTLPFWEFYHGRQVWLKILVGIFAGSLSLSLLGTVFGFGPGACVILVAGFLAGIGGSIWWHAFDMTTSKKVVELLNGIFLASAKADVIAACIRKQARKKCQGLIEKSSRARDCKIENARPALDSATQQSNASLHLWLEAEIIKWQQKLQRIKLGFQEIRELCRGWFPDWFALEKSDWLPQTSLPPAVRFGEFGIDLYLIPKGVSSDRRFAFPDLLCPSVPALAPFPQRASLLIKGNEASKSQANLCLQAIMLRLLTVIPPGKVRFTIIDPIGLGENFATFMHLADHDESLVTSRIWTESRQIEQQLEKITEHMEMVIQKYLRGRYKSIDEYNAEAGEVAEPYRFVVVANFPAKFSQAAAERLLSIASVGPRCGVYLLMTLDTTQKLPHDFNLRELEQQFVRLNWIKDRFVWDDPDFGIWSLRLDEPPAPELFTAILRCVGEKAKDGNRVEVPFEFIAPVAAEFWKGDSRSGLVVPLGRAGATKRQCLQLGQGTAQHVLIAGKTGSGKSSLLHALITNLALIYGPDEVELYLVDFKKGVEFKTYAIHTLAHARVVAIESEREFGLSVLQRLDAELKLRGDAFRALGVQDVAAYRHAQPGVRCPRILLVVDEFQEFFVEDDKIARDATLLLDRLVRQGRAFGIHVILGSQTLGGAYSLARATIDQMAVRIALQCSDADARLILSDDNSAARLVSRPGEAIYNDANGLLEGNNLFQVVWLPDDRREDYLRKVQDLSKRRRFVPPYPQIVFEGNIAADISKNHLLNQLLISPASPSASSVWKVWLGEAISIKDPTCAVFRPQGASNLLIVGQQEETAIGVNFSAMVSLAAQHPVCQHASNIQGVQFYLFDGTPADSPYPEVLAGFAKLLPAQVRMVGRKHVVTTVSELLAEVNRRIHAEDGLKYSPVFLIVHGLQYYRDLRRQDEPLSRRLGEQAVPNPAKEFLTIIREGPSVRVHTILWCDTLTNLNRTLDRQGLKEFEMRVVFQMGATDSTTLIEAPLASKLGLHRAYFFHEERGTPEKFRPYGLPTTEWIGRLNRLRPSSGSRVGS